MRDHMTVKLMSYDQCCIVGSSESSEKLWINENQYCPAIDECSYSVQFPMIISYLNFMYNVR